jgi:hypothetical protein
MSNDIWYKEPGWYALGLAVLSLIVSGISLYFTWWANYHAKREDVARALLSDGLAVHALSEAWILEGPAYREVRLSTNRNLTLQPQDSTLWLRRVEIRAVLDQAVNGLPLKKTFITSSRAREFGSSETWSWKAYLRTPWYFHATIRT